MNKCKHQTDEECTETNNTPPYDMCTSYEEWYNMRIIPRAKNKCCPWSTLQAQANWDRSTWEEPVWVDRDALLAEYLNDLGDGLEVLREMFPPEEPSKPEELQDTFYYPDRVTRNNQDYTKGRS